MVFQPGDADRRQAVEHRLARLVAQGAPILLAGLIQVADRDDGDQGILTGGGLGRVEPGWRVDVQAGVCRHFQVADAFEIFSEIIRQEQGVRPQAPGWVGRPPRKS